MVLAMKHPGCQVEDLQVGMKKAAIVLGNLDPVRGTKEPDGQAKQDQELVLLRQHRCCKYNVSIVLFELGQDSGQ